jgi:hypothetical protein
MRELTDLNWERVPSSGALDPKHGLKGDLYVPNEKNLYCVEVKSYENSHIDHLLVSGVGNHQIVNWMQQSIRQGAQVNKKPLLLFKHNRSKIFCAYLDMPEFTEPYIFVSREGIEFYISMLDDYIKHNNPVFVI